MTLYRQGDVLIQEVEELPSHAYSRGGRLILAFGQVTGHTHEVHPRSGAKLYTYGAFLYLVVTDQLVRVEHPEHGTIELPQGNYKVWQQREFGLGTVRD